MTRLRLSLMVVAVATFLGAGRNGMAAAASEPPSFKEVYDLLHSHLEGASETELEAAAVQGLLSRFYPRVMLMTNEAASASSLAMSWLSQSRVFDDAFAYLRVAGVGEGLAKQIAESFNDLSRSNRLKGGVLDLRFAGGDDYAAAAAVADLFMAKAQPLLDWGKGVVESQSKLDAIKLPLAILVNPQTAGAPEALAAVLRETRAGLVIGDHTAGQATIGREFTLKTGQRLRIATAEIKLGNGTALTGQGIKPDILLPVDAAEEKAFFADAYAVLVKPTNQLASAVASSTNNATDGTNRPARRRLTEADLVRERREELNRDAEAAVARREAADRPMVRDPVLARALDLLKALAIVGQFKQN